MLLRWKINVFLLFLIFGQNETAMGSWDRLVGGGEAIAHEFPHVVRVAVAGLINVYCAGAVVNENWIVTAAHCADRSPFVYVAWAGEHSYSDDNGTEQWSWVDRIEIHPRYNVSGSVDFEADVALMHLATPYTFNDYVKPAVFAQSGFEMTVNATVIGWGDSFPDTTLQKVTVPYVTEASCKDAYGDEKVVASMTCYGEVHKDACTGDSGAPLMCGDTVCGLVSWGYGCGLQGYPTVYSEMSYFTNWVLSRANPRDEDPFPVTTILDCGGRINTTSARININSPLGEATRCSWLAYIPYDNIRLVIRNLLHRNSTVHITEFLYTGSPLDSRLVVLPNQNNSVSGPLFIISVTARAEYAESFTIEMYGSGVGPYYDWDNAVSLMGQTGTYSYPEHGGNYDDREVSHFLHSPNVISTQTLTFTRMDIEYYETYCAYDGLQLFLWNGTAYSLYQRFCGFTVPEPIAIPLGEFLLLFTSNGANTYGGFAFGWW